MFRRIFVTLAVLAMTAAGALWFISAPDIVDADAVPAHEPDAEHGRYVFFAAGCAGCHATPDQDDPFLLGGGHELDTPFGIFRVPNISPDPEFGIGGWSTLEFVNAMVRGVAPDGRHYYPSLPYTSYQRMDLTEVLDLKAFLDSVEPVQGSAGDHDLGFPYNLRRGVGLWKRLYLDGEPFSPDPGLDEVEARGAYLVTAMAHCGECHTPRDAGGGLDHSRWLAGGPAPEGDGRIPNITPHEDGIASWSANDIAYSLATGFTPDFDSFGGSMARVVRSTRELTDEDRQAIAAYLQTVPPLPDTR
jgi:mono/diheme cytochrome c family protein